MNVVKDSKLLNEDDLMREISRDNYNERAYVDTLVYRSECVNTSARNRNSEIDSEGLENYLRGTIERLQSLDFQVSCQAAIFEEEFLQTERTHGQLVQGVQERNLKTMEEFKELDERITSIGQRIVGLGEELEALDAPKTKVREALELAVLFDVILIGEFSMKKGQTGTGLYEDAERILKLHDLVRHVVKLKDRKGAGLTDAEKATVSDAYQMIKNDLLTEFKKALVKRDRTTLRLTADKLSKFQFPPRSQNDLPTGTELYFWAYFEHITVGFDSTNPVEAIRRLLANEAHLILDVFPNSTEVLDRVIFCLYDKLSEFVESELGGLKNERGTSESERYLRKLYRIYGDIKSLTDEIQQKYRADLDGKILDGRLSRVFHGFIDKYLEREKAFVQLMCCAELDQYFRRLGIDRHASSFAKLTRNVSAEKANLDQELINMNTGFVPLYDVFKPAFERIRLLSRPGQVVENAAAIFDLMVQFILSDFIEKALSIAGERLPPLEPKSKPDLSYFKNALEATNAVNILRNRYLVDIKPLLEGSPALVRCQKSLDGYCRRIEDRLNDGLEHMLTSIVGFIKYKLKSEQRASNFLIYEKRQTESSGKFFNVAGAPHNALVTDDFQVKETDACLAVRNYIRQDVVGALSKLDGRNQQTMRDELAVRFHKVVFDHIYEFKYTEPGALILKHDIGEYRRIVDDHIKSNIGRVLFDTLHDLCNILYLSPDQVRNMCGEEGGRLASLDRAVLQSFVQLRHDFDTLGPDRQKMFDKA